MGLWTDEGVSRDAVGMVYSGSLISRSGYGRPRDNGATERIFDGAVDLLVERGYAGTTIAAVAARAGCGTQTIYRRFVNRDEMLLASIEARAVIPPLRNSGRTIDDLVTMLGSGGRKGPQRYRSLLWSAIALESERHPEFLVAFRRGFVWPLRRNVESVLVRAVRRGEIRDDVDMGLLVDLLLGFSSSRFWSGGEFEDGLVRVAIGVVLRGVGV
jgi:AcrR family transcriptional regulator